MFIDFKLTYFSSLFIFLKLIVPYQIANIGVNRSGLGTEAVPQSFLKPLQNLYFWTLKSLNFTIKPPPQFLVLAPPVLRSCWRLLLQIKFLIHINFVNYRVSFMIRYDGTATRAHRPFAERTGQCAFTGQCSAVEYRHCDTESNHRYCTVVVQ